MSKAHHARAALIMEVVPGIMRLLRGEMRRRGGTQLTVPQFRVLNYVFRAPATNRELAEFIGVSAPTMSTTVDLLIRRGLLTRRAGEADRRHVLVEPTPEGRALAREIRDGVQSELAGRISKFPEAKLRAVEAGLEALRETLL